MSGDVVRVSEGMNPKAPQPLPDRIDVSEVVSAALENLAQWVEALKIDVDTLPALVPRGEVVKGLASVIGNVAETIRLAKRKDKPFVRTEGLPALFFVVETDNYGRDYPNERMATPYGMSVLDAKKIADILNGMCPGESERYFKVVESGYVLQPGFVP